jgi:hypothetical protein
VLNDFLNNSLVDDGALLLDDTSNFLRPDQAAATIPGSGNAGPSGTQGTSSLAPGNPQGSAISRPASVFPTDKA